MDHDEDVLLFALLRLKQKKRAKRRKLWVHPLMQQRIGKGLHHTLYDDLRDSDKFFTHFRMSKNSFDELLSRMENNLRKEDTIFRKSIPPAEKLALTLRYLGQGCSMTDLHITYRLGLSTVSGIIRDVCGWIWSTWTAACFPKMTEDHLKTVSQGFAEKANFPHCVGALDGKHIRIIKPQDSGSLYFNYKHFFSILLLALCDSDYNFMYIHVGSYGKSSDSTVFKNSTLHKQLEDGTIKLPKSSPLPGQHIDSPYMILGDEGFGLSQFILRPYGGSYLSIQKRVFNYRHCRGRRFIECSFGILAKKWAILHRPLNVNIDLAELIIRTCCLLHNFVRARDGYRFKDTLTVQGFNDMPSNPTPAGTNANKIRDRFANFFMSPKGEVSWQLQKI